MIAGSIANMGFFYAYADGKKKYHYDQSKPYTLTTALISLRAGIFSMTITAPLWTIKTRLALYREPTKLNSIRLIGHIA